MNRKEPLFISLILIFYGIMVFSYLFTSPPLEPPDEALHYEYIREIADEGHLPDSATRLWSQFLQPPAYYLLLSPILMALSDEEFAEKYGQNLLSPIRPQTVSTEDDQPGRWENPYFGEISRIPTQQNKNLLLRERSGQFPYSGNRTAFAIFILRLTSVALGFMTLFFSYRIFRVLWPDRPYRRFFALGTVAFWPIFQWMTAAVNNDTLLFALSSAALYLMLLQQRDGMTRQTGFWLGIVFGLAILTKSNAFVLALPMGAAVITDRRTWRYVPLILIVTLGICGWWYLRNRILYGSIDFFDHPQVIAQSVTGDSRFDLDHALKTFPSIFDNFWARFNIILVHAELDLVFRVSVGIALLGLLIRMFLFARKAQKEGWTPAQSLMLRQGLVIVMFVAGWFGIIFYASGVLKYGHQGRYTLHAIAATAVLLALGWETWIPQRLQRPFMLSGVALMVTVSIVVFAAYYRTAYAVLPVPGQIPHPLAYHYEDLAKLIGASETVVAGQPGETVVIDLYWEALRPAEQMDVIVYVGALGNEQLRKHSYPAGGNLIAPDWEPGQRWRERYFFTIPEDSERQRSYPLITGLYRVSDSYTFLASDEVGNEVFPVIGQFAVQGEPAANPDYTYRFGDLIGLKNPLLQREGDQIEICLEWVALASPEIDYHYFVHLYQGDEIYEQGDGQPRGGAYPTNVWLQDEVIPDCITVNANGLDAEDWSIRLGLYEFESGVRLPVRDRDGSLLPNDQLALYPSD